MVLDSRLDAGAVFEFVGGAAGERGADDTVAVALPDLAGGVEREGLAGAGLADDHRDRRAVGAQSLDHDRLLVAELGSRGQQALEFFGRDGAARSEVGPVGVVEDALLAGE